MENSTTLTSCPYCRADMPADEPFCPACGKEIGTLGVNADATDESPETTDTAPKPDLAVEVPEDPYSDTGYAMAPRRGTGELSKVKVPRKERVTQVKYRLREPVPLPLVIIASIVLSAAVVLTIWSIYLEMSIKKLQ